MMLDFKILNEDGKLPTTEQLSQLLITAAHDNAKQKPLTEQERILTELIARPDEFLLESSSPDVLEGAAYYSKFDQLFGRAGLGAKIMNYHEPLSI